MGFKMRALVELICEGCVVGDDGTGKEWSEGGDGLLLEDSISFEFLSLIIYDRSHGSFIPSLANYILFLNFPFNFLISFLFFFSTQGKLGFPRFTRNSFGLASIILFLHRRSTSLSRSCVHFISKCLVSTLIGCESIIPVLHSHIELWTLFSILIFRFGLLNEDLRVNFFVSV